MTFEEAEKELIAMAKGPCHSLTYEKSTYSGDTIEIQCRVYIHNYDSGIGATWREALDMLKDIMNPPSPKPIDKTEAPVTDA